ncbi:MAG: tetratricopeptide repeat protein [Deltaproteobacteria bacterium]|nr:MAG: tetratricopeptide repeat protein [Deltaproteobacteria bacterium]
MARRIKKKDLKKPDEFITLSGKIVTWCRDNKRFGMGVATGVVFLLLFVGGFFLFKAHREAKARVLYQAALTLYPDDTSAQASAAEYAAAASKLEELRERYGSTSVAIRGLVDLGNAYFQGGDYDKAISSYQDFLQRADSRHPLRDQVLESLGTTYEAKGSWDDALGAYEQLAREGAPAYQQQAELYLGRVYEALGDRETAMNHYQAYLEGNPRTGIAEWIRTKVAQWQLAESSEEKDEGAK